MGHKDFLRDPHKVSTAELSEILGVTPRRIQQLTNDKALVRVERGQFDLTRSIKKYIEYEVEKRAPMVDDKKIDAQVEAALWTKARKEKTELEVQIIKGELHRSRDVERIMNESLQAIRAGLLSLPSKMAPQLVAIEDIPFIKDILTTEIKSFMEAVSNYDKKVFYEYSTDKLFLENEELEPFDLDVLEDDE
ncbi:hypothetical protein M4D71_23570 [Niallia taxi]|uniref:hypothetical protein n=1 Tax=Niallia taxi TaxID=2499688 RepID=UPI0021A46DF6|nr:hypothetical protein [Niallia taxi]MCT2347134.1 hypothetical protein [Niallia taxi]